jgi:hypothetical protein
VKCSFRFSLKDCCDSVTQPKHSLCCFWNADGDQLESDKGLSGPGKDGLLALNPAVFPENVESLDWKQIKPSCGFIDGTVAPAKYSPPHDNHRSGGPAELHIQCDEGASSISLNEQEYFPILPVGKSINAF